MSWKLKLAYAALFAFLIAGIIDRRLMMAVPTTVVFGAMLALILVSRRKTWQCADCKLVTTTSLLTRRVEKCPKCGGSGMQPLVK